MLFKSCLQRWWRTYVDAAECGNRHVLTHTAQPGCVAVATVGRKEYDVPPQEDLQLVQEAGAGRVGITVGSALDIFGGGLAFEAVLKWHRRLQQADT